MRARAWAWAEVPFATGLLCEPPVALGVSLFRLTHGGMAVHWTAAHITEITVILAVVLTLTLHRRFRVSASTICTVPI